MDAASNQLSASALPSFAMFVDPAGQHRDPFLEIPMAYV
jgi:hypothetical protein